MGEDDPISRRGFLQGTAAGVAAAAVGLDSTTAEAHISKFAAHYRNRPNGRQRCGLCRHFRPPHGCARVRGRISPYGWCRLWAPRGHRHRAAPAGTPGGEGAATDRLG